MPSDSGQPASTKTMDTKGIKQLLGEIEIMYNECLITKREEENLRMDALRQLWEVIVQES